MRVSVTRDDMKDEVCVYCSPLATKGTRSLSAVTPIAAALLAVTSVRMYVINNSEVKQTTATYYLHAKLSPTTAPIRPSALAVVAADMRASVTRDDMKDDEV